jgi:hypothetical protein
MPIFDSGVFDVGVFDSQPANQVSAVGFEASTFGSAALGNIVASGFDASAFGTTNAAQVFYGVGFETSAFGLANAQQIEYLYPPGTILDAGFGIARADLLPLGGFGSQNITVPYFTDTSIPLPHAGARIACTGFTNQLFGDLTHETWKFGGTNTLRFGTASVGAHAALREGDARLPGYNSVLYVFGTSSPPKIYCFGLDTLWGRHTMQSKVDGVGLDTLWGTTGIRIQNIPLVISSTRLPSAHTTVEYRFGQQDEVTPDTFIATEFGTAIVANAVSDITLPNERVGDPMVTRYNPPALRIRDAKNTTLKFDGVPFQFGYPKRDIFCVGVKPGGFGLLRSQSAITPMGFDAQKIWDWSAPWMTNYVQYVEWIFSSGYAGHPLITGYGSPTVSNGGHGIRPKGEWLGTVANTLSVANVNKSIHPYHGRVDPLSNVIDNVHTEFGTPSATVDPNFIPAKYIYPQPFTEVFRVDDTVWYVEPRNIGPVGLGQTQAGAFVQCVLLDPDYYAMQGFKDDAYGYPEVKRGFNIRPTNWDTVWGVAQVTHYTRSVYPFQPLTNQIIGNAKFQRCVHPDVVPSKLAFGDVHQWHENTIQLRPWQMTDLGIPRTQMVVAVESMVSGYVPDPRMAQPLYADTFWATIMGHDPSVAFTDATTVCGQVPRAVVPKGFPITQFGDFDAVL